MDSSQPTTRSPASSRTAGLFSTAGWTGMALMAGALALAAGAALWKLLAIGGIAFAAMAGGAWLGRGRAERGTGPRRARRLVWGYGASSGAMITSAAAFLVPSAIGHDPTVGGFGIAAGVLLGFALHVAQHQLAHWSGPFDGATLELTAHAAAAGLVIGAVYATMSALGLTLGLAIVSHKGPAGYAAARRLHRAGRPADTLLVPAAAVAVTAVPVGLLGPPAVPAAHALVFGVATGIFLHVALDFLPQCEIGGELMTVAGFADETDAETAHAQHHLLDRLRLHAVASTTTGGLVVLAAWWALHA